MLRVRLRDWCWPFAVVIAVAIPFLGVTLSTGGTYRIGSFTYHLNTQGPIVFLLATFIAGLRWCWIGRLRAPDPNRCIGCHYRLDWLNPDEMPQRCPECGRNASRMPASRRIPVARLLLDLPGVLAMLFPIGIVGLILLSILGFIDLD